MKYQGIRKIHEGKYITRYDVDYVTAQGHPKTYEIVSRNRDIRTLEALQNKTADSVIMILTDESGERILLNREYRMAMAQWLYNFPAGLIDPGETPEQSARRELWEETGLTLTRIDDVLDNSYSAVGFSNERNICVFGAAAGEFRESTSDAEEIAPGWYTREDLRRLLRTQPFAARTQAYCYAWANGGPAGRATRTIYLAGGCFWGLQKFFDQFDGVVGTEVGYANGPDRAPSYQEVCADSGHAETVRVDYDPARLSLEKLLDYYFMVIDPLSVNRQGHDEGVQYRTGIYYTDADQLPRIEAVYRAREEAAGAKLAVELMPLQNFFSAEEYHQKYLDKNPGGYCHIPREMLSLKKRSRGD